MSKLEKIMIIEHGNNKYVLSIIKQTQYTIPILLDNDTYKDIYNLGKKWYINEKNHVYCMHTKNDTNYPIYMHEIIMKLNNMRNFRNAPILHINNIHFDNRKENLQYDIVNKDNVKNTKKKNRTIDLSEHGIETLDIPTYVWYLKPDNTHGERFAIEIPNELSWRTTSSKKVSLKYKLEEAKKYLRNLRMDRPDIFELYSMNGDLTLKGTKLLKEYKRIIEMAGFSMDKLENNKTYMILEQNTKNLTDFEEYLLDNYNPYEGIIDINKAFTHYFG